MKPNNFFYVKCLSDVKFLRSWVEFLTPYHRLTSREKDVAARILQQYIKIKDSVPPGSDPDVVNELLWSRNSRKDMMASLEMTQAHFQMSIGKLKSQPKDRAKGNSFLQPDGSVNPLYIPHIIVEDNRLLLQVMFDWSSPTHPVGNAQSA